MFLKCVVGLTLYILQVPILNQYSVLWEIIDSLVLIAGACFDLDGRLLSTEEIGQQIVVYHHRISAAGAGYIVLDNFT